MELYEKIAMLRKARRLTLEQVGKYVGVGKSTVRKWETGVIKNIGSDKIKRLANALDTTTDFLMDWNEEKSNLIMPDQTRVKMLPLYNSVSAGFGEYASSEICGYMPVMPENENDPADYLCIKVKGDSMTPLIQDGDTVIVRKQETAENGQIAVILKGDEGFVKRINKTESYIELISENESYPPIRIEEAEINQVRIVGIVKNIFKLCK